MTDYTGQKLGGYEVKGTLGKGAMGTVYLADQTALQRAVAVKVLEKSELPEPAAVERFQGEARAVAALNHPNVMGVFDVGESEDCYFMAMELIEGESMGDRIRRGERYSSKEVMDFGGQAARGLAAAHEAGLIHRDVKPDNILITTGGLAKVADFGLAKQQESDIHLTQTGAVYGSPAYMSPEQCQGGKLTTASDIYSLGVTLYYALAGHAPFDATSAVGVMMKHVTEELNFSPELQEEVPRDLLRVIERCMAKEPDDRWPSAAALAEALERIARGEPLPPDNTVSASSLQEPVVIDTYPTWLKPAVGVGGALLVIAVLGIAFGGGKDDSEADGQGAVLGQPPASDAPSPDDGGPVIGTAGTPGAGASASTTRGEGPEHDPAHGDVASDGEASGGSSGEGTANGEDESGTSAGTPPPTVDLGRLVVDAMAAERKGELTRARELLEEAAAAGDLPGYSTDAAGMLEQLHSREAALVESREAVAAGDLEAALAAAGRAHELLAGEDTLVLKTDLGIAHTELATIADQVDRGKLTEAAELLQAGALGPLAPIYDATARRLERYRKTLAAAERALQAEAWDPAAEGLAMARAIWDTEAVRTQEATLESYRAAIAAGEAAAAPAAAVTAFEEAFAAMPTSEAEELLTEARYQAALTEAETATEPAARVAALERALELQPDDEIAALLDAARAELPPSAEERVTAAVTAAEGQLAGGNHAGALTTLHGASPYLTDATPATRARHATVLARARSAAQPAPPVRRTIPEANRLFTEAERLRKTPLTLFSDKNEQSALTKYEHLIRTYPTSDKLADAYFGAAHVAENLEQIYKAVDYWQKAAQLGYHDPVECYLLAADVAEDDADDPALARRLLQSALNLCQDHRRATIQAKLRD